MDDYIEDSNLCISSEDENLEHSAQKHKLTMFAEDYESDHTTIKTITLCIFWGMQSELQYSVKHTRDVFSEDYDQSRSPHKHTQNLCVYDDVCLWGL